MTRHFAPRFSSTQLVCPEYGILPTLVPNRSLSTMTQNLTPEVRQIIERVLQLEKDRLDRKKNSPINDDILKIIKEVIT